MDTTTNKEGATVLVEAIIIMDIIMLVMAVVDVEDHVDKLMDKHTDKLIDHVDKLMGKHMDKVMDNNICHMDMDTQIHIMLILILMETRNKTVDVDVAGLEAVGNRIHMDTDTIEID